MRACVRAYVRACVRACLPRLLFKSSKHNAVTVIIKACFESSVESMATKWG